jgi:Ni,Fe-hydrogenase maturation factor
MLGLSLPELVTFWGVEARECALFSEELSAAVAAAVPLAAEMIISDLTGPGAVR